MQAVVVNLGSPEAPNYQLSLQSTTLGDVALQLNDGTNNLLSPLNTGADAILYRGRGAGASGIAHLDRFFHGNHRTGTECHPAGGGHHHRHRCLQPELGIERTFLLRQRL